MNERSSYVTRSRVEARQSSPVVIQRSVELWRSHSDQLFSRIYLFIHCCVKISCSVVVIIISVVFERNVINYLGYCYKVTAKLLSFTASLDLTYSRQRVVFLR